MKNTFYKLMGAGVLAGLTAVSAGAFDDHADPVQTAAKKPKVSALASAKKEGRALASEAYKLLKDSNEVASEARSKKITDDTCDGIDFPQVLSDIKSLKKDFVANIETQTRLGAIKPDQKKQHLDGLDVVEKTIQDNVKVIRESCPQKGMFDVSYRFVDDQVNEAPQAETNPQLLERKPLDRLDQLAFARLESADIQRRAAALAISSAFMANAAKGSGLTKEMCAVVETPFRKTLSVDLMSTYRQTVQAEVDNGGETPANYTARVDAMQKIANAIKINDGVTSTACFRTYGT